MPIYNTYLKRDQAAETRANTEQINISNQTLDARYKALLDQTVATTTGMLIDNKTRELKNTLEMVEKQQDIADKSQIHQIRAAEYDEWTKNSDNRKLAAQVEANTNQSMLDLYSTNPKQFGRLINAEKLYQLSAADTNTFALEQERRFGAVNEVFSLYEKSGGNLEFVNKYAPQINAKYAKENGKEIIPGLAKGQQITPELMMALSAEREQLIATRDYIGKIRVAEIQANSSGNSVATFNLARNLSKDISGVINQVLSSATNFTEPVTLDGDGEIKTGPAGVQVLHDAIKSVVMSNDKIDPAAFARKASNSFFERSITIGDDSYGPDFFTTNIDALVSDFMIDVKNQVVSSDGIVEMLETSAKQLAERGASPEQVRTEIQNKIDQLIATKVQSLQ